MIGILLALKVNNWNGKRINKKIKNAYLVELQKEASTNLKRLDSKLYNAKEYVKKVDDIYLNDREITKSDLDKIGIIRQVFSENNTVYKEMISGGQLKLIPKDIKTALIELYTLLKKTTRIDGKSVDAINFHHLKMAEYYEVRRLSNLHEYKIISTDLTDQQKALLIYKNYINATYD